MDLQRDIKSVTDLKLRPADILSTVNRTRRPMIITQNGQAKAVVQDVESYELTRKALLLLKLTAQSEADVRSGRVIRHKELSQLIEKKLSSHE